MEEPISGAGALSTPLMLASSALEATLPPTPVRDLLAADGAGVFVCTRDAALVDTVQLAAGNEYPVFSVTSMMEVIRGIEDAQCGIVLLDLHALGRDVQDAMTQLFRYSHRLVLLVACDAESVEGMTELVCDRKIHRVLVKPPTVEITRMLLESAVSRHLELRAGIENLHAASASPGNAASYPRDLPANWPSWVSTGLVVIGVTAALVFAFTQNTDREATAEAPDPAPVVASLAPAPVVESPDPSSVGDHALQLPVPEALMLRAERALQAGRLATPLSDSALGAYLELLELNPNHAQAEEGVSRVLALLLTRAEVAIIDERLDDAASILEQVRKVGPDQPRLEFLGVQLDRERARLAALREAEIAASQAAAPPSELDSLLALATARLDSGFLWSPEGDSALHYLERAQTLAADDPEVARIWDQLAANVLGDAQALLEAGELSESEEFIATARDLGADEEDLATLETALVAAKAEAAYAEEVELMALARARLATGQLLEPDEDNAHHYLLTVLSRNPDHPGLSAALDALGTALSTRAEEAIGDGGWTSAARWLEALNQIGKDPEELAALRRALETGQLQAELLANPSPASEMQLVEYEPPVYPPAAIRRGVEGWVLLEFIVDREGLTRDVVPVSSEPPGQFEESAIAAVSGYRFVPYERDGRLFERRLTLRLRFALQ